MTGDTKKKWRLFLASASALALLTLFSTLQLSLVELRVGSRPDYLNNLVLNLLLWLPWAPLAYFILRFSGKHPIDLKRWYASLPLHTAAMFVFSLMHGVIAHGLYFLLYHIEAADMPRYFIILWAKTAHFNLLVYAAIVSLGYMWEYYRKNQLNRLKASQLEARLSQARLEALQNRLNPHFLFNTLHTILALVRKDPETAEGMLTGLSDLLRKALDTSNLQEVPLKDELDVLNLYLEIQKVRLGDRLKIEFAIDPQTLNVPVPNFILQPVVENAVQHGIAPRAEGGSLSISSEMEDHRLILRVKDSGPGFPEGDPYAMESGFGLDNTRARLDLRYGPHHSLHCENAAEGGALVTMELPIAGRSSWETPP